MAETETGEATEAPTGRRLEKAREDGNIAQSKELHLFSSLGMATIVFIMVIPSGALHFVHEMRGLLDQAGSIDCDPATVARILRAAMGLVVQIGLPVAGGAAIAAIMTSAMQTGFLLRPQALIPDIGRLSPLKGLKRIFGVTSLIETLKSIAKIVAFSFLLWGVVRDTLKLAPVANAWSAEFFGQELYHLTVRTLIAVLVMQAMIVVLDEGWTRYHRLQGLKMSRQDIKDEMKQSEGDPHVKGRRRQIQMSRTRRRIREAVGKATVVITNPTHYAVALEYTEGSTGAPKIVAKGADEVAARIREFAWELKVPIVSNPPLARALYKLPEDTEIPYEYFQAVAAVIAYVWKLRRPAQGAPPVM